MDRIKKATNIVKALNSTRGGSLPEYEFIKLVCAYFDSIKYELLIQKYN